MSSIVNFLQEEHKLLANERDHLSEQVHKNTQGDSAQVNVKITIIQGTDLVAKDIRLGQETSDPYVELWFKSQLVGTTRVKNQTLKPVWNERFDLQLERDTFVFKVKIWDEDFVSPDEMGAFVLEVPSSNGDTTSWFDIPKNSNADNDASGKLQLRIEVESIEDPTLRLRYLEKEVRRLRYILEKAEEVKRQHAEYSLLASMEFLKEANQDLMKERASLVVIT